MNLGAYRKVVRGRPAATALQDKVVGDASTRRPRSATCRRSSSPPTDGRERDRRRGRGPPHPDLAQPRPEQRGQTLPVDGSRLEGGRERGGPGLSPGHRGSDPVRGDRQGQRATTRTLRSRAAICRTTRRSAWIRPSARRSSRPASSRTRSCRRSEVRVRLARHPVHRPTPAAPDRMNDIVAEAQKPGADFAALAKANSEDATASTGGDVGWVAKHQLDSVREARSSRLRLAASRGHPDHDRILPVQDPRGADAAARRGPDRHDQELGVHQLVLGAESPAPTSFA